MDVEKIAFFDVDHTIIRCVSAIAFLKVCIRRRIINPLCFLAVPFLYMSYRLFRLKIDVLYRFALRFLKDCRYSEIVDIAGEAYRCYMHKCLDVHIMEEINRLRTLGVCVKIATSAPFEFVADVAKVCNVADADVIATRFCYKDEVFTGMLEGDPVFGDKKRDAVFLVLESQGVSPSECSFYSDSIHDLPLLRQVGKPIAVCPDIRLRHIAQYHHWRIIEK